MSRCRKSCLWLLGNVGDRVLGGRDVFDIASIFFLSSGAKMGAFWSVLGYVGVILGGDRDKSLDVWLILGNGGVD